jgi:hypothetical protein
MCFGVLSWRLQLLRSLTRSRKQPPIRVVVRLDFRIAKEVQLDMPSTCKRLVASWPVSLSISSIFLSLLITSEIVSLLTQLLLLVVLVSF